MFVWYSECFLLALCLLFHGDMASSFSSPWPDPNSPVLSKIDFGVPLVELFKWLDVRDTLLGQNKRKQDITAALDLARECKHPDAVWLTSIFEGKNCLTRGDAQEICLVHKDDALALCFAWWLSDDDDQITLLVRAAQMGHAFACSTLSYALDEPDEGAEALRLAKISVSQLERDGFRALGQCFRNGIGCDKDLNAEKENYLIAAELGDVYAAQGCGDLCAGSDLARWIWWSRAVLRGSLGPFLYHFSKEVQKLFSGSGGCASAVFLIGRTLKGNIEMDEKQIFGSSFNFAYLIVPANQAVLFYESQVKSARLAVDTWTLVSTRLHLMKDLRIYIGKMIWEARIEANYKI